MPLDDYLKKYSPDLLETLEQKEREDELRKRLSTEKRRGLPEPHGALSNVFDFLSRGNYGAAKFTDVLVNEDGGILGRGYKAFKEGLGEIVSPNERLVFKDVIKRTAPVWSAVHEKEVELFDFVGNVVVDPINAISFGSGGVLKGAPKILGKAGKLVPLSKKGEQIFTRVVSEIGEEGLTGLRQRKAATEVFQELLDPSTRVTKKITGSSKDLEERILRVRLSKAAENEISEGAGVFLSDYEYIQKLAEERGVRSLLSPDDIKRLKEEIKAGSETAERTFDSIVHGSPKVEVSPISQSPSIKSKIKRYGSSTGRPIGVVIPPRYITKTRLARDQSRISSMFASTTLDPSDLRFVIADSDKVMSFTQLKNHIAGKLSRETAEQKLKLSRIRKAQSILDAKNLTPEKLVDPGGFKILGRSIINSNQFKSFFETLDGIPALKLVNELPPVAQIKTVLRGLSETFGLQHILERDLPEWVGRRRHIEAQRHQALETLEKSYLSVFEVAGAGGKTRVLNRVERGEINEFLSKAQKETKDKIKELGLKNPSFEFGQKVFRELFNSSNLSKEQKSVVVKLQQAYNDMHRLEAQAGITKDLFVNYNPARYESINRFHRYVELRRWQTGVPVDKTETFTKTKKFISDDQALAAGYQPIRDAGQLYAMRFLEHHAALRRREWQTYLKKAYPSGKIPREIDKDLVRLGEKFYEPHSGAAGGLFMELFDGVNRAFRKSATVVRVGAFASKQIVGNFFQSFAEMGVDAFRVFDPTVLSDSMLLMTGNKRKIKGFTDVFGVNYTGDELLKLVENYPVRKNVAIEDVGFATESDITRRLTSELYTAGKNTENSSAMRGMEKLYSKGLVALRFPAYIEDMYRIGGFLGGIKAGHSPDSAIRLVDNALFNYTSGLTRAEQNIRRWAIPFFSYQKFGLELLTRTAFTKPGRLSLTTKTVKEFFTVWNKLGSGDQLTESERSVLPGYLLEQPHVLEGFDEVDPTGTLKAKFRTFNNMMFLDVVNFLEVNDKTGELDLKETLMRGTLSQIMPFWKVPLEELVFERELFTDRALEGVYAGQKGDLDYDKFVSNLATYAGLHGGLVGAAGARGLAQLAKLGPAEETIKKLISWEEGINPQTGERFVSINPYMLHTLTSLLPSMNTALKLSSNDYSFWDKTLYAAFGVGTIKLDLERQGMNKLKSARYEFDKKRREYQRYLIEGRMDSADLARQELIDLMEYNEKEADLWTDPEIRGGQYQ
jgi:hypothetical protein